MVSVAIFTRSFLLKNIPDIWTRPWPSDNLRIDIRSNVTAWSDHCQILIVDIAKPFAKLTLGLT